MLNMEHVRVLIVDDHAHAREAICSILSEDSLFEVIGTASSGQEALELTEQWMPDLILMDVQMPDMDGLEATRLIKLRYPYVIIVMVTVSDDVTYLFEALKQGAQGYLLKTSPLHLAGISARNRLGRCTAHQGAGIPDFAGVPCAPK